MTAELELLVLAIASAFWPLLIAVVVLALRTAYPVRILTPFLAAALLTTVTEGLLIVAFLRNTGWISDRKSTVSPVVDLVLGGVGLAAAAMVHRPERIPRRRKRRPNPWTERAVRSGRLAFAAGIVLNLIPGIFPFVALTNIAFGDYNPAETVGLVIVFYLIMFAFLEIPLAGYVVAPERATATANRFNDWLDRNLKRVAVAALVAAGCYEIVRGLYGLLV